MKYREFVYAGEPVPAFDERECAAFFLHVQEAILFSLEKQKLLTPSQRKRAALLLAENIDGNREEFYKDISGGCEIVDPR